MEDYARRGVFRGLSQGPVRGATVAFKLVWFRDRVFDMIVDTGKKTVMIPVVLPCVPGSIYRDFRAFVLSHYDASLPDHRRIEIAKTRLRCANQGGNASITLSVKDGDYDYALRRLIHLIHETYVIFLLNGMYRDYAVANLGAEID